MDFGFSGSASCSFGVAASSALAFRVGPVDHAVVPSGERRAGIEAAHRAEPAAGIAFQTELVGVAEAAVLPAADGAEPWCSSSAVKSSLSCGRLRIRSDASNTKRLIAAVAMHSRSPKLKTAMGCCSRPLPSSHRPISPAASRVTCACHASSVMAVVGICKLSRVLRQLAVQPGRARRLHRLCGRRVAGCGAGADVSAGTSPCGVRRSSAVPPLASVRAGPRRRLTARGAARCAGLRWPRRDGLAVRHRPPFLLVR